MEDHGCAIEISRKSNNYTDKFPFSDLYITLIAIHSDYSIKVCYPPRGGHENPIRTNQVLRLYPYTQELSYAGEEYEADDEQYPEPEWGYNRICETDRINIDKMTTSTTFRLIITNYPCEAWYLEQEGVENYFTEQQETTNEPLPTYRSRKPYKKVKTEVQKEVQRRSQPAFASGFICKDYELVFHPKDMRSYIENVLRYNSNWTDRYDAGAFEQLLPKLFSSLKNEKLEWNILEDPHIVKIYEPPSKQTPIIDIVLIPPLWKNDADYWQVTKPEEEETNEEELWPEWLQEEARIIAPLRLILCYPGSPYCESFETQAKTLSQALVPHLTARVTMFVSRFAGDVLVESLALALKQHIKKSSGYSFVFFGNSSGLFTSDNHHMSNLDILQFAWNLSNFNLHLYTEKVRDLHQSFVLQEPLLSYKIYENVDRFCRTIGQPELHAMDICCGKANALIQIGTRNDEAIALLDEYLRLAVTPAQQVDACRLIATIHRKKGNHEEAKSWYQRAFSIAKENNCENQLVMLLPAMLNYNIESGELGAANTLAANWEQYVLLQEGDIPYEALQIHTHHTFHRLYSKIGQSDRVIVERDDLLKLYDQFGALRSEILLEIAEICEEKNQLVEAETLYVSGRKIV